MPKVSKSAMKAASFVTDWRPLPPTPTSRAFAVLDRPLHVEALLEVLRRVLKRHYENLWPQPRENHGRPIRGRH